MTLKTLEIAKIDASNRLRPLRQMWVDVYAEQVGLGVDLPPIEVVARGDGYKLITGGHRLAGHKKAGRTAILADVKDVAAYADEAACRLREIQENMIRVGMTELDRAVALAEWKRIYEIANPVNRGGHPKKGETAADSAEVFYASFSEACASALGISERTVRVAILISGNTATVRERIAAHRIADSQVDLLALAHQTAARQAKIADLLLAENAAVHTVADAIALLDKTPAPARAAAWEKLADRFGRLKERDQNAFFNAHTEAIDRWLATRGKRR